MQSEKTSDPRPGGTAERDRRELLERYEALEPRLRTSDLGQVTPVSAWSIGEHLFHVLLANELCLQNVAALVAGSGMLVRPFEAVDPRTADVLSSGKIPRGEAEAPRFVRPPVRIDLEVLGDLFTGTRTMLKELDTRPLAAAELCVPHQLLGDLTAIQWLRFANVHTGHHLLIIDEIEHSLG